MKVNLNGYILENEIFLINLFDNNQINFNDYEKYIINNDDKWHNLYPKLFELCDEYDVNIYPYLYILEQITIKEKINFTKFLLTYMNKNDMLNDMNEELFDIISKSIENIFILIVTIQYYFL